MREAKLKSFSIGRVGVNINGDPRIDFLSTAKKVEKAGVKVVWIGEFEGFDDPFEVARLIAEKTSLKIGFGIVSPLRKNCEEIAAKFSELVDEFGDRFLLGLGAGEFRDAGKAYKTVVECAKKLRNLPLFIGASSPKLADFAAKNHFGLLINAVSPTFVSWLKRDCFSAAYGPALLLPSEFEDDLLIAALIVFLGHVKLVERFGFENLRRELAEIDVAKLIEARMRGEGVENELLERHRDFLLENFTLSGSADKFLSRLKSLLRVCDHVVLADPFFRDPRSLEFLEVIVCETS